MAFIRHPKPFPFCAAETAEDGLPFESWDGETYLTGEGVAYGEDSPSKSSETAISVVGPGTPYPIAMYLETAMLLFWKLKYVELELTGSVATDRDFSFTATTGIAAQYSSATESVTQEYLAETERYLICKDPPSIGGATTLWLASNEDGTLSGDSEIEFTLTEVGASASAALSPISSPDGSGTWAPGWIPAGYEGGSGGSVSVSLFSEGGSGFWGPRLIKKTVGGLDLYYPRIVVTANFSDELHQADISSVRFSGAGITPSPTEPIGSIDGISPIFINSIPLYGVGLYFDGSTYTVGFPPTIATATLTAKRFWPYDPGDGIGPVYDETTGDKIRSFPL